MLTASSRRSPNFLTAEDPLRDTGQIADMPMWVTGCSAGSTLRARSNEFKAELMASFQDKFGAALEAGRLKPIIDRVSPAAVRCIPE